MSERWGDLRRRLEAARGALESSAAPDPDRRKNILSTRANVLARPRRGLLEERGGGVEVLEFGLSGERYAFETRHVRGVHRLEHLRPLPGTPAFVLGIVNLRGEILSVLDLRKFFELPEQGLSDLNRVVVLEAPGMVFGVLADVVLGTKRIQVEALQGDLPTLDASRRAYLLGIGAERLVVLDGAKLLGDERVVVRETNED